MNTSRCFLLVTALLGACSTAPVTPDLTREIGSKPPIAGMLTIVQPAPAAPLCLTGNVLHRCDQKVLAR